MTEILCPICGLQMSYELDLPQCSICGKEEELKEETDLEDEAT